VLVWSLNDNRSININDKSAWYMMNGLNTMNVLAVYLRGNSPSGERGKVWAFGRGLVESSILGSNSRCGYPYRVEESGGLQSCAIRRGSFAYEILHIRGDFYNSAPDEGGAQVNLFTQAVDRPRWMALDAEGPAIPSELYTRAPAAELYPNLPPRLNPHPDRNLRSKYIVNEVLEYPDPSQEMQHLFYDPGSEQMTDLIPLYRYWATGENSEAHNKYCAFRYKPDGLSSQGEIVYFFFQMYPFRDDQIRRTAKVVLTDWFGLPDPDGAANQVSEAAVN
jgi:hypothetical protein